MYRLLWTARGSFVEMRSSEPSRRSRRERGVREGGRCLGNGHNTRNLQRTQDRVGSAGLRLVLHDGRLSPHEAIDLEPGRPRAGDVIRHYIVLVQGAQESEVGGQEIVLGRDGVVS